jgi:hypothetical protein
LDAPTCTWTVDSNYPRTAALVSHPRWGRGFVSMQLLSVSVGCNGRGIWLRVLSHGVARPAAFLVFICVHDGAEDIYYRKTEFGSITSCKGMSRIYLREVIFGGVAGLKLSRTVTTEAITVFRPPLDRPLSPLVQLWLYLSTPYRTLSMGVDRGLWTHVCPHSSSCGYMCICHMDTVRLPESMSVYVRLRIHSTVVIFC